MDTDTWFEGQPAFKDGAEFEVKLEDGSVRPCRRIETLDYTSLFFTDCTHPQQNAYCSPDRIKVWRFKHG